MKTKFVYMFRITRNEVKFCKKLCKQGKAFSRTEWFSAQAKMLKENKIVNGSSRPPQGLRHFILKTWAVNQVSILWLKWKNMKKVFYAFHIRAGLVYGPLF